MTEISDAAKREACRLANEVSDGSVYDPSNCHSFTIYEARKALAAWDAAKEPE